MTNQSPAEALRQQLLDLKIPDRLYTGQTIHAKLEDLEALVTAYAATVEREARIDELKQLDFDTVADRRATITFGQVEARLAALQGPQDAAQ